ncbi:YidC/Oxa1 family membrane protein insertase [Neglectibacter sp. CSJ-5]|uniref:YidC/Oxa1 family membrane protein insertase n=1 Tax=Neglectibacter sp. CSJ-5 TaxID=3078043 RepID=UPI00292E72F1|nr:YidC/Oxa1 family membrane protein insertase [Neglectibacter sp. CSJ-5]
MMSIFNFFGSVLGYLLWFLYTVFKNYGIAIILFTIIVKALMFPFSIKSQKSMAAQSRLASKQQELQKKYAKDQMKYNEELQKLYEKEGVNPGGGCLTTLLPFPIMLGIYYSVIYPLSNTLHIAKDTISQATEFVSKIPGIASTNQYVELEIVKNFDALKDHLTMFSADDVQKIEFFGKGFKCFGLDLLASPNTSLFASMLWIIPVLALVTYWGQSFVMQKLQPTQQQGAGQGCMKVMMYGMPLLSAYWAYIMPAAVGFYWIISALVGFAQTLITHKYFSPEQVSAKSEASRYVTLLQADRKVKPLPANLQKQIADKIEAKNQAQAERQAAQKEKKATGKKGGNAQKNKGNSTDYLGSKK